MENDMTSRKIASAALIAAAQTAQDAWERSDESRVAAWREAYKAVVADMAAGLTTSAIAAALPKGSGVAPATVTYIARAARFDHEQAWEAVAKIPGKKGKKPTTLHAVVRIAQTATSAEAVDALIAECLEKNATAAANGTDAETIDRRVGRNAHALVGALMALRPEPTEKKKAQGGEGGEGGKGGKVPPATPAPKADTLETRVARVTADLVALRDALNKGGEGVSDDALHGLMRESGAIARDIADVMADRHARAAS